MSALGVAQRPRGGFAAVVCRVLWWLLGAGIGLLGLWVFGGAVHASASTVVVSTVSSRGLGSGERTGGAEKLFGVSKGGLPSGRGNGAALSDAGVGGVDGGRSEVGRSQVGHEVGRWDGRGHRGSGQAGSDGRVESGGHVELDGHAVDRDRAVRCVDHVAGRCAVEQSARHALAVIAFHSNTDDRGAGIQAGAAGTITNTGIRDGGIDDSAVLDRSAQPHAGSLPVLGRC